MSNIAESSNRKPTAAVSSDSRSGETLQRWIDEARPGTCVRLPAGTYVMRDSLRLRSDLTIDGGGEVVLTRAPLVESPLACIVGYGHCEFQPADPALFDVGMGYSVSDNRGGGFGVTVGRIVGRNGDLFLTDTPFHRDFRPSDAARVRSIFPLIAGYDVSNAAVEGIIVDGGGAEASLLDGCRDAGVFLIGCRTMLLAKLEVRGYPGDAISFQQCADVHVEDCHLHHNAGHGLHPGSGTVRYVMQRNRIHDNGNCGIFYCLRTTHSECLENVIESNGAEGITIGERDTDHLVEGNTVRANRRAGIRFRRPAVSSGDRVIVRRNTVSDNGAAETHVQIDIAAGLEDVVVVANTVSGPARPLVRVSENCRRVGMADNQFSSPAEGEAIESASPIKPAASIALRVGPAALPLEGARHLRIDRLEPWGTPTV